mgnify:CR=1 FL=1
MHQGDGTARIFADEPRVFTFSMHGERNYPVRKASSSLDVGLPDGTRDEAYLARLAETCLLYTSDAADERSSVDLGGRRIIKKKKKEHKKKKNKKQTKKKIIRIDELCRLLEYIDVHSRITALGDNTYIDRHIETTTI